jgi:hypothetical protein
MSIFNPLTKANNNGGSYVYNGSPGNGSVRTPDYGSDKSYDGLENLSNTIELTLNANDTFGPIQLEDGEYSISVTGTFAGASVQFKGSDLTDSSNKYDLSTAFTSSGAFVVVGKRLIFATVTSYGSSELKAFARKIY